MWSLNQSGDALSTDPAEPVAAGHHGSVDTRLRVLRATAVAGPVLFTADWLLLGLAHDGYRPRQETISSLSAHGAADWPVMVVGQLALAAALLAVARLCAIALGRAGALTAGLLGLAALGTLQLSAFRTICNRSDAGWCTPLPRSAFPQQQWLHGIGTAMAFAGLQLACVACARATWRVPGLHDLAVVALVAEAVALPAVLWFLANAETTWHGLAEKVFLVSLATFTGYAGLRLADRADDAPAGVSRRTSSPPP